jgi:16S rRNA (uracil1498-N3)-methyltransferase
MTRRRWIADEFSTNTAALTGSHADHLVRVLRVRVGQEFDIATGDSVRRGKVTFVTPERVEFELGETLPAATVVNITLLLSIFKFDRLEWAIEKCTELGVAKIIPIIARRTDAHLVAAATKRIDRWRRIAMQSAEQSRRAATPQIEMPLKIAEAVKIASPLRIVLSELEKQISLHDVLTSNETVTEVILAIGPEGGWTEDEFKLFEKSGWVSTSLGNTILRAETAAIAATAIVTSMLSP